MESGSSERLNNSVSLSCGSSAKAAGSRNLPGGDTAYWIGRFSHWLVAITLGLASPSMAVAANDELPKTDSLNSAKSHVMKAPKPYPLDFPVIMPGNLETLQVQPPNLAPSPESPTMSPEASSAQDDSSVTASAELMLENTGVSVSVPSPSPALVPDATGPASELGFSGFDGSDEMPGLQPITSSFGAEPVADTALDQTSLLAQTTGSTSDIPWRFSFEPFFYLPFGANGDVTVRGINAPINAGIGDIFDTIVNDLNFAAFGRVEAWNGPWGIFFSGAYTNLGTGRTADIPVPPVLQQVGLPPQASVSAATGTSFVQLDLGGAYRFGDGNLPAALRTADTEFDLGPFVFDALAGVRLYSFNNDLVLTGPLGNQFEFSQSRTIVEPMIGGRARWNLSHNLAALASANMSGFGIGNLTFSASGFAGIDWLFSGNTSLLASYGFTYLNYSSGSSGLDLFTHGPRVGVKFRF